MQLQRSPCSDACANNKRATVPSQARLGAKGETRQSCDKDINCTPRLAVRPEEENILAWSPLRARSVRLPPGVDGLGFPVSLPLRRRDGVATCRRPRHHSIPVQSIAEKQLSKQLGGIRITRKKQQQANRAAAANPLQDRARLFSATTKGRASSAGKTQRLAVIILPH